MKRCRRRHFAASKVPNRADRKERNEESFIPLFFIGWKSSIFNKKGALGESRSRALERKVTIMKYIAIPNTLIFSRELSPSAKRVALALLTYQWEKPTKRHICKKLHFIAERAGVCVTTARSALEQLERTGFLSCRHSYRYREESRRIVYAASCYSLHVDLKNGYTLLPYTTARKLLATQISHAAFAVYLVLACRQGQNSSHAYPSLRTTAANADVAKATVCRALLLLIRVQLIVRNHCGNRFGCYSCNSYYVIVNVIWSPIAQGSNHHDNDTIASAQLQAPGVVSFLTNLPI